MDSFCFSPSDFVYKALNSPFPLQFFFIQLLIRVLFRLSFVAMSSNGKSISEKTNCVEAESVLGPINPVGTPYVSSSHSIGDPHSKQSEGEASVTSCLTKLSGKTAGSSGVLNGLPKSKNPNGMIIHSAKSVVSSGVRGKAVVSSSFTGKAIVTAKVGEVMTFKDVKYGPHDGELRFQLIHFWEARNVVTKVLISVEMLLIDHEVLSDSLVLDDAEIAASRRVLLHVQTHDGPVMKLYLWDKAASDFSEKFKASGGTARVVLVTALNPKRFGGALALSSMTPSRVFLDTNVQETKEYLAWMEANLAVANRVNADVVTKAETVSIGELFSYMKQEDAKVVAWFECIATIGDVVHGSPWYYIGCGVCHTKATKGPTTLMCKKCGKTNIVGYLAKISVYDNDDQASFVLLGDAGHELVGRKASELVARYFEGNENVEDDHFVPMPQALIDTIGQTRKFIVKVSDHNLTGKTQTLTVTKVLTPEIQEVEGNLEENMIVPEAQETLQKGVADDEPSTCVGMVKRAADDAEAEDPKRARCG
ncbi:unnamed protein product [Brassica oleracea]